MGPNDLYIDRDDIVYVAEGCAHRVSMLSLGGKLLGRWGEEGAAPGQFNDHPHWLWVDSHGDVYVSEVMGEYHLQKFARV